MHFSKKISLLLFVAITSFCYVGCKKEEVPISQTTPMGAPKYLAIGTILKSKGTKSISNQVSYVWDTQTGIGTYPSLLYSQYGPGRRIGLSDNGMYSVEFQGDGNLCVYKLASPNGQVQKVLWATNKYNMNIYVVNFRNDGNIIVSQRDFGNTVWSSNTSHTNRTDLMWIIQDDGNFVGYPTNYYDGFTGLLQVTGPAFADTGTWGGRVTPHFGRVNRIY